MRKTGNRVAGLLVSSILLRTDDETSTPVPAQDITRQSTQQAAGDSQQPITRPDANTPQLQGKNNTTSNGSGDGTGSSPAPAGNGNDDSATACQNGEESAVASAPKSGAKQVAVADKRTAAKKAAADKADKAKSTKPGPATATPEIAKVTHFHELNAVRSLGLSIGIIP